MQKSRLLHIVVNVWLPCPCHVVAPAILQSLIVPLCSLRGCCVVLAVSIMHNCQCSFSAVCPPWEAFDQLRCCVCFRVWLLACSAPWLSGVFSELKPGFLQIVFSKIRRRVCDTHNKPVLLGGVTRTLSKVHDTIACVVLRREKMIFCATSRYFPKISRKLTKMKI